MAHRPGGVRYGYQPHAHQQALGGVRGVPLNPQAAGRAARIKACIGRTLTWAAALSMGASAVFFLATIFISSDFAIPYAISMIATLAFGFTSDCYR